MRALFNIVSRDERTYRRKGKAADARGRTCSPFLHAPRWLHGVHQLPPYSRWNASKQVDGILRYTQAVCTLSLLQSSWELRAGPAEQTSRSKATLTAAIPSGVIYAKPRRNTIGQYWKGNTVKPFIGASLSEPHLDELAGAFLWYIPYFLE